MKRPSLKLRITGWFALMMFVIEALVLAFLLAVNGTVATNDPEARLVRMVEHNANRVKYNNRQFRFSRIHYNRSGVYTVLYDADGNVLQGTFPAEFTPAQPLPLDGESVRLVDCGDNAYYVYDVRVDMMVGSVWLRGVINADANGGVMRVILPLAWSLLPVLLVLSVIGGYFIASRALRLRGYTVLEAGNAEEALQILDDPSLVVDIFVTDVVMPGMDGPTWVKRALEDRPDVRVVFVSGYAEDHLAADQSRIPNSVFLPKPFSLNDLTATVQSQLHQA